ncbi:large ribosomal subunit protein mL48-like [Amazona ochrocephala]
MSAALPKVLCLKKGALLKQVFALSRAATPRESHLCAAGDALLSCHRHYRSHPTHGIGRFKYLLPKEAPKKKKDKVQMKEINAGTDYEYGDINIQMTAYDMCLVEHFAQYVRKLCNRLSIRVNESYAMPTKTEEVLFLEERGSKLQLDAVLTTHQRVIQISHLSSTFAPILLEIIQSNQPEGKSILISCPHENVSTKFLAPYTTFGRIHQKSVSNFAKPLTDPPVKEYVNECVKPQDNKRFQVLSS